MIDKYSEKAVIVHGDTKPVKNQLKTQGGRFNPRLKHPSTGLQIPGWIFSKKGYKERKVYDILRDCQRDGIISGVQVSIISMV